MLLRRPRHEVVPNYYYDGNLHMVHHDAADANNSMFWLTGAIVGADAMYRVPTNVGLKLKKQHRTWGGRYNKKKLVVSRQPIFLNLKSNTMKNRCKGIAIILFEQEMGDKNWLY